MNHFNNLKRFRCLSLAAAHAAVLIAGSTVVLPALCRADEAKVFFKSPENGATVTSPVSFVMGVEGMKVAPAGEVKAGEGHHHVIIDGGPVKEGDVIPADATHVHFGKAQTEASIPLPPGKHSLTLQFADGAHRSLGEKMSSTVAIFVK